MAPISTSQPWQQRPLNRSGIRRLKLVCADSVFLARSLSQIIPQNSFTLHEFVFPADLSCSAVIQRQETQAGSVFWIQTITFTLPHLSDEFVDWIATNEKTLWVAIAEDYNEQVRAFGGALEGLNLSFQASTGANPRDTNPMAIVLSNQQLIPYMPLSSYQDSDLFGTQVGFSYGFSMGFSA